MTKIYSLEIPNDLIFCTKRICGWKPFARGIMRVKNKKRKKDKEESCYGGF